MSHTQGARVRLMTLSERTSGKGNAYLSGWLGKASVVAFRGEPDKFGNETWDVIVSTPEPKPDTQAKPEPAAKASARPEAAHEPRQQFRYVRKPNGRPGAPAGDGGPFHDDPLDDLGRP